MDKMLSQSTLSMLTRRAASVHPPAGLCPFASAGSKPRGRLDERIRVRGLRSAARVKVPRGGSIMTHRRFGRAWKSSHQRPPFKRKDGR